LNGHSGVAWLEHAALGYLITELLARSGTDIIEVAEHGARAGDHGGLLQAEAARQILDSRSDCGARIREIGRVESRHTAEWRRRRPLIADLRTAETARIRGIAGRPTENDLQVAAIGAERRRVGARIDVRVAATRFDDEEERAEWADDHLTPLVIDERRG